MSVLANFSQKLSESVVAVPRLRILATNVSREVAKKGGLGPIINVKPFVRRGGNVLEHPGGAVRLAGGGCSWCASVVQFRKNLTGMGCKSSHIHSYHCAP